MKCAWCKKKKDMDEIWFYFLRHNKTIFYTGYFSHILHRDISNKSENELYVV